MTTFPLIFSRKALALFGCLQIVLNIHADSTDVRKSRIELLMNISNALSRFTGNGNSQSAFNEPFLVGMKITNKKKTRAFRLGTNFSISKVTEDLSGTNRISQINSWAPLLGYEWRKNLGKRFQFYGGVDVRYYNETNITDTRTPNTGGSPGVLTSVFKDISNGGGFGPFCGFVFNINEHVSLLTEANFYVNYIHKVRTFSSDGSNYETFENSYSTTVSPNAPSSIFLLVRF